MAKLSAHGSELARYFDPRRRALISIRSDGTRLGKSVWSNGWKVVGRKKPGCPLEQWKASKLAYIASLPAWAQECKSLLSEHDLSEWVSDAVCETPNGDRVEPDGHGPDGVPSWLLLLGLV